MRSRHLTVAAIVGGMVAVLFAATPTANADPLPPCHDDGRSYTAACPSGPINGYNPYDPSGQGFLRGFGPDSSWIGEGQPTITNPQGVVPVTRQDVYTMICIDLDVHGVSVASVEDIYHVLYERPYQYSGQDAGRAVALAVQDVCPSYKSALMEAGRQALS